MTRCWSCGAEIPGGWRYWFTCPTCSQAEDVKRIRRRLESFGAKSLWEAVEILGSVEAVTKTLEVGLGELSEQLVSIASILEWGFETIEWKLDQTRETLKSIDKTLKTPSMTQANEWRQIAEELRERGLLGESEKFFLKSLETNPLDYRTYIGLGKTELQTGKLEKARSFWEKSLPHAPKGRINYKSYSYRLIGRTYFCEEKYQQAASTLKNAIELSPIYWFGHYDYAQYCALTNDKKNCLSSLRLALMNEPLPIELVRKETNLQPFKQEIEDLWAEIQQNKFSVEHIKFRLGLKKLVGGTFTYKLDEALKEFKELKHACIGRNRRKFPQRKRTAAIDRIVKIETFLDGVEKLVLKRRLPKLLKSRLPVTKRAQQVEELIQCVLYWALDGKENLGIKIDKAKKEKNRCRIELW